MLLSRATIIVSKMPHRLSVEDLTREEAHEVWAFLSSEDRLSMTRQAVKVQLAKECGVFIEQMDAVANGATLTELLVWESSDSDGGTLTLENITAMFRNPNQDDEWVLDLCNMMNTQEAELAWRWALGERLIMLRNRMRTWGKKFSVKNDTLLPTETLIDIAFGEVDAVVVTDTSAFKRLRRWVGDEPDAWWLVPDCATLLHISDGAVRNRRGDIDIEFTPLTGDAEPCWSWVNAVGTLRCHTVNQQLSYSKYQEPMSLSWAESMTVLQKYPKSGYIILHEGEYHLLTSGSITLYAQALTVRRIKNIGYEFTIGFKDGLDIIDTATFRMKEMVYDLESSLKMRGITLHNSHTTHDIPDGLVLSLVYTWSPSDDWHLRYAGTHRDMGISDVDEIVDYYMLVGEDNE